MPAFEPSSPTGVGDGEGGGGESTSSETSEGIASSAKGHGRAKQAKQANEEQSFMDWLGRYSIGRVGPSDQMPKPPPSILAILNEQDGDDSSSVDDTTPSTKGSRSTTSSPQLPQLPHSSRPHPGKAPISVSITLSQGSSQQSSAGSNSSTSATSMSNPAVSDEMAASLLEHFRKHGTFPAPPGPWEEERLRLAHKYGLDQPVRRRAIDRICAIAKAHFKTKMVVVSLTFDDHQVLGAERGFDPNGEPTLEDPVRPLEIEPAFCTHAMASSYKDPTSVFIVADANKDWRFKRNPYATKNGGGVSFYAAANVNLPVGTDADKRGLPKTLASGALCLMDPTKKLRNPSDFSEEDRAVLRDLAEMIAREFQLGFEQRRREEESKQSEFLGSFLQQALVQPAQPGCLRMASSGSSSNIASPRQSPPGTLGGSDGDPTTARMQDQPFHFPSNPSTPHLSTSDRPPPVPLDPHSRSFSRTPGAEPPSPPTGSNPDLHPIDSSPPLAPSLFATAAENLVTLTRARSCGILDLRAFRSSHFHSQSHILRSNISMSPTQASHPRSPFSPPLDPTSSPRRDPNAPPTRSRTGSYGVGPGRERRGKIGLMASEGEVKWAKIVKKSARQERQRSERLDAWENGGRDQQRAGEEDEGEDALTIAVEETLRTWASMTTEELETQGLEGAFGAFGILPDLTTDTLCVPIFDVDGSPALMIVLSSTEKWFRFESTDRRFIQSVGAIIIGSLLRERARDSDRAKLAFISQVSHELRTPLHGINSQLELIREFSSPPELRKLAPLLDVADVCLESLSDVLNDTLDFSKLSNNTAQEAAALQQRSLTQTDLAALIEGVLKSTWVKKRRVDLASVDLGAAPHADDKGKVDLILEVEGKEDGWEVMTDIGGMKRVLLNIVGNALKFTKRGHVRVTLRFLGRSSVTSPDTTTPRPRRPTPDQRTYRGYVLIVVQDTGIGMTQEFLRDGMLFTPFKQADPFASGAGLGLSICDSIVKRLGPGRIDVTSQLDAGTEISVTLPLDFVYKQPANSFPFNFNSQNTSRPTSSRRIISDELNKLLGPPSQMLPSEATTPPPVPPSPSTSFTPSFSSPNKRNLRPPQVDFPHAVAAVQASLASPVQAPETGPTLPSFGQDDLAIEAAKLAIATTQEVDSSLIPMSSPLPVTAIDEEQAQLNARKEEEARAANARQKKVEEQRKKSVAPDVHVLFADDNPVARNILVKLFTGKGIKFSAAEDGQQAVDLFKAGNGGIAILFLDVQMPVKDGLEAAHDIRVMEIEQDWPRSRIIALTGLSNETDMAEALGEGGVDKWLVKGGKSLRVIMEEVVEMQKEVEERRRLDEQ